MNIQLLPLRKEETIAFKEEIQEAFQQGFQAHFPSEEGNTSTSIAADSMPLSFSMIIILSPTCLSSLTRKTGCSSLKRETT